MPVIKYLVHFLLFHIHSVQYNHKQLTKKVVTINNIGRREYTQTLDDNIPCK